MEDFKPIVRFCVTSDMHYKDADCVEKKRFEKGATVLFVSHSLDQVKRLCDKAILLEKGRIIASGGIEEVSEKYLEKTGGAR